jgi:enterochelin esterase-like enzyme
MILALAACSAFPSVQEKPPQIASPTAKAAIPVSPSAAELSPTPSLKLTAGPGLSGENSCLDKTGAVQPYSFSRNGETFTGRIYTPPCYPSNSDQEYPVLYLLHGATETDQQWDDLGVDELADSLITQGKIRPLIIVMPRELTWISLPNNPFGENLIKEVVPWVDQEYRTLAGREYRAIGGLSRGGNWAVRLGMLNWGTFGSIGAHSTPLFYGDLKRISGWIKAIPEAKLPRIYQDIGLGDNNLGDAEEFDQQLTALEIPHEWHLNPGLHNDTYWKTHLEEYLLWYSAGWGT